ncbi:MAG: hypothetical protein ACYS7Y_08960, partial [Planctomycetota bacterium]
PLKSKLRGQLPTPGHFELAVDTGTTKGTKWTKEPIQNALIKWIKDKAPLLQLGSPNTAPHHHVREGPHGVPFQVTLYRWPRHDGELRISMNAPASLQDRRRQRISEALERKCPKLCQAREDKRISILLLESDDMSLGNCWATGQATADEMATRNDLPDEVYLVETDIEPWTVWILKDGTDVFPSVENPGPYYLDCIE